MIDGTITYDTLVAQLSKKYNSPAGEVNKKISSFLIELDRKYSIRLCIQSNPNKKAVRFEICNSIYPVTASIELTYKCNLHCLHCYGDYGNIDCEMKKEDIISLLNDLKSINIKNVEFTGGDISVYPQLIDVLLEAKRLKFNHIVLLTNGIVLSEEVLNFIIENKDTVYMQIDLHSLHDEYLTWFTKRSNTLNRICKNIELLASNGVLIRVSTIVTKHNVNELYNIADWAYGKGVSTYAISPVMELGRALDENNDLFLSDETLTIMAEQVNKINDTYKGFLRDPATEKNYRENCGCITTDVCITPEGDIKVCAVDDMKSVRCLLGNVFKESIKEIFDNHQDFVNALFGLVPPDIYSLPCVDCSVPNKEECHACIIRTLKKVSSGSVNCAWYNSCCPDSIKSYFHFENS